MTTICTHLNFIHSIKSSGPGCVECLRDGGWWVTLRRCVTCGHIGCCDSSPGKHATAHAHHLQHPLIQSYEPEENWFWCYIDEVMFDLAEKNPSPSHPPGWSPGPPGKVPQR